MKSFDTGKDPFEFHEIDVVEGHPDLSTPPLETEGDDIHKNLDGEVRQERATASQRAKYTRTPLYHIPFESLTRRERKRLLRLERKVQRRKLRYDYKTERARLKAELAEDRRKYRAGKPRKYHWAFFLSFALIGLAFSIGSPTPMALFIGAGLGMLFFVDPIYEKAIQMIKEL